MSSRGPAAAFTAFVAGAPPGGFEARRENGSDDDPSPRGGVHGVPDDGRATVLAAMRRTVPMTIRVLAAVLAGVRSAARQAVPMSAGTPAAALAACLAAAPAAAQEAEPTGQAIAPTVETTVSAAAAAVGDPITVIVTARHAPDAEVQWPDPVEAAPFELLDPPVAQSATVDGVVESRLELRVAAFELGDLAFPPLDVEVVDAAGGVTALTTEAAPVVIESIGRDEGGDIRDIKGPLAIPFAVVTLLPWVAVLLALAAAAAWLYRRYRRRARPEAFVPAPPPRPAHEVAREALDALEAAGLLERGEIKTYHIRLSDIVRVYVEGRFGVDAMEMTTGEVLGGLLRTDADRGAVADVRRVLDRCDLVKFAKLRPAIPECRELLPLARRVVDVTAPVEAPLAGPATVPAEQTA